MKTAPSLRGWAGSCGKLSSSSTAPASERRRPNKGSRKRPPPDRWCPTARRSKMVRPPLAATSLRVCHGRPSMTRTTGGQSSRHAPPVPTNTGAAFPAHRADRRAASRPLRIPRPTPWPSSRGHQDASAHAHACAPVSDAKRHSPVSAEPIGPTSLNLKPHFLSARRGRLILRPVGSSRIDGCSHPSQGAFARSRSKTLFPEGATRAHQSLAILRYPPTLLTTPRHPLINLVPLRRRD